MLIFEAVPVDGYATLHKISILGLIGIKTKYSPYLSFTVNFSILPNHQTHISHWKVIVQDKNNSAILESGDFYINDIVRWRVNISQYDSFHDYLLKNVNHCLQNKYEETQTIFYEYGASVSYIEGDWSKYVEDVHQLYMNTANKHGMVLYDLNYFYLIAKRKEYKLMCFWYKNSIFAAAVILDEEPILHGLICGLDYHHSKMTRVYSQMNYEIIRLAIASKKHTIVDVGFTSDKAKAMLGFHPVPSYIAISSENRIIKLVIALFSRFCTIKITEEGKIKFNFHFRAQS